GIEEVILPLDNVEEASLVKGIRIRGFDKLSEVVEYLEGVREYQEIPLMIDHESADSSYDFSDVQGQAALIEYCVVAAAGGHNLLMVGQPGCGKSMIAKRLPSILPQMNEAEALEVTKIFSVAGLIKGRGGLIRRRPFRAPHHNASTNALIGGGMRASPGEVSLAHNGVLFLDEITEFEKRTLDSLRQPLEDREVTVSRVKYTNRYPCAFILVAAMNPCACGYFGSDKCQCSDYEVLKYRQKVSGPLLDRIDIQKQVNPIHIKTLAAGGQGTPSEVLRARVNAARKIQEARFAGHDQIHCNAQMTHGLIRQHCRLEQGAQRLMEEAYGYFKYSARSFYKFLKIARTMADLDGADKIRRRDMGAALMSRDLEKDQALIGMRSWQPQG
ncbi:MAG: YifB family Mg chelatase-like AAA ATPase, partial [Clostridiaceae bacterium]|nr:YifB family Mg chelatase-like AAA ATPase [Clostridiaceae bacterium]